MTLSATVRNAAVGTMVRRPGPKRVFVGYRPVRPPEGGPAVLFDTFREFDRSAGGYVQKEEPTSIRVLPGMRAEELVEACDRLRRELDESGVKMFFDRTDGGEVARPKWRYRVNGRLQTDYIATEAAATPSDPYEGDPDTIPRSVVEYVMSNADYFRLAFWRFWFGRKIQRKREQIIEREAGLR